jgi:hypothetical protein
MNWFNHLLDVLVSAPSGLEVDEPDPIQLTVTPPPGTLFRALPLLLDPGAVLYWEGRPGRTLAAWLGRHTLEPRAPIEFGILPASAFYHLPLDPDILAQLALRVDQPKAVGSRVRIHIHVDERIVLEWRPAFGTSPLLLSRRLPSERIAAFIKAVSARTDVLPKS